MIPVEPFNNPVFGSREYNAVKKAVKEKPKVSESESVKSFRFFNVKQYRVCVYEDADSQFFVECNCMAGTPPIDEHTQLPSREAQPCYHAAAVLIHLAESEK